MPVKDYSSTPASNTAINGIACAPDMPRANVDNAIRQLMADIHSRFEEAGLSVCDKGATGDGTADDTAEVQLAFATDNILVHFPHGKTVKITAPIVLDGLSNVAIFGHGCTLKGGDTRFESYFDCSGAERVTIEGFIFDQMKSELAAYTSDDYGDLYNVPIYADNGNDIHVSRCKFTNLYTSGIYFVGGGSGLTVRDCEFTSPTQTQTQWLQHIHCQTVSDIVIEGNRFVNASTVNASSGAAAIFASGVRRIRVQNNFLDYCGRDNTGTHRVGAIDFYGDVTDVYVTSNVLTNCMAVAIRLNACHGGEVSGNRIAVNANAENAGNTIEVTGSVLFGTNKGTKNVRVLNNIIEDPSTRAAGSVVIVAYDWGAPTQSVLVDGNVFTGCLNAVRVFGPFRDIKISNSTSFDGRGNIIVEPNDTMSSDEGVEADSMFDVLDISDNFLEDSSSGDSNAINVALDVATSAYVGSVEIINNTLRANPTSTAAGVVCHLLSSDKSNTRSYIRENEIEGYDIALNVRDHGESSVENNRAIGFTTFLSTSGMTIEPSQRGNRMSAGAIRGTATLVAGAATVNTAEIQSGDTVMLSRQALGGTAGHLSVGTITAGTSFVINSSSGTDTSTISWEVVH